MASNYRSEFHFGLQGGWGVEGERLFGTLSLIDKTSMNMAKINNFVKVEDAP